MAVNGTAVINLVFEIANKLRGPYRPPQYRKVMLPMTVLRRLDCVLEPTKAAVLAEYARLQAQGMSGDALHKVLAAKASGKRRHPLYNVSAFTLKTLLGDPDNIAANLVSYIHGFSANAREIFEKFGFEAEIEKLDKANRLFLIVREFTKPAIDLHPDRLDNHAMGEVFEELVRRFNEQANEEAGDHFTPREVIRLMTHLVYTNEEDVYRPGIVRTIYDPACGTGGMLSVSEAHIRQQNPQAHLNLFGQEYNEESWALCCSDMLIKDEPVDNIVLGDTLGDGRTHDGHEGRRFHYMLANPPFGVEWKPQEDVVDKEYSELGFNGRFGPGLPRISDGATLFLLHMISKMHPAPADGGEGSKIAIVFNGSPLFNGDPGPSESNIRRWIIENDWLDAIVALPDQLFYNTGILTYVWLVTNRKPKARRGKVQLIDGSRHFVKMAKSRGAKRHRLGEKALGDPDHIGDLTRLYSDFADGDRSAVAIEGKDQDRVCGKIFDNRDFAYLRLIVERPLRLNFQASGERIERLKREAAFVKLAQSRKRKDAAGIEDDVAAGKAEQKAILATLGKLDGGILHKDRDRFEGLLEGAFRKAGRRLAAPIRKAILSALSERDPTAEICLDADGNPEPDPELRDTEMAPLPAGIALPLPLGYERDADNSRLVDLVQDHCEAYLAREVLPFIAPDTAWIDHAKTRVGYEIPINRHFYVYEPPRPLAAIEADIKALEDDILTMLKGIAA